MPKEIIYVIEYRYKHDLQRGRLPQFWKNYKNARKALWDFGKEHLDRDWCLIRVPRAEDDIDD